MFLGKTKRIHFIGIGGSGMSGIAEVLIHQGYGVSGSDKMKTPITNHLEKLGAKIFFEHSPQNIEDSQVIVVSNAIGSDNAEVIRAKERMIPIIPGSSGTQKAKMPHTNEVIAMPEVLG